jgi:hypothetical protein
MLATASLILGAACAPLEAPHLLARRLPGPPGEEDWRASVPLKVLVSGGSVHRVDRNPLPQMVDQDTVHRNTASCHHGPAQKVEVAAWIRAFYDDRRIYLRVTWGDLTADREGRRWVARGGDWRLEGDEGDGVALAFPLESGAGFSCASLCHLDDWQMRGGRFQESARMRTEGGKQADIWLWRASGAAAREVTLDGAGFRRRDGGLGLRLANSRRERILQEGGLPDQPDGPLENGGGSPPGGAPPAGEAPAYLPLPGGGGGGTMHTDERYRDGLWEVTFSRLLDTGDPRDVSFQPGTSRPFSLSILDNTRRDHHINEHAWQLRLIL